MNALSSFAIHEPHFQFLAVRGTIERRILVNFRCDQTIVARHLPAPFRPKLVNGYAVAGICLIHLGGIRPAFLPALRGLSSENAAHRIAVEWDENGTRREGVFIPRRDTDALLNRLAGGRLFPGLHNAATFRVLETANRFELEMRSDDATTSVHVRTRLAEKLTHGSIFRSLDEASEFFRGGSLGWSSRPRENEFDGLELRCDKWRMEPLFVEKVESSFLQNPCLFPAGSAEFDSAFLMRDIPHRWHSRGRLILERANI